MERTFMVRRFFDTPCVRSFAKHKSNRAKIYDVYLAHEMIAIVKKLRAHVSIAT